MESAELLSNAREAFIKNYAQTPEKAGFSVVRCWNNEVVFAKDEQVFTALQKSQKLIKIGLNSFLFIVALWIIMSIISIILLDTMTIDKFPFWTILVGLLICFGICIIIQLKCNKWEAVYLKDGCHLIYNGKRFYAIKNDDINPHAAFF